MTIDFGKIDRSISTRLAPIREALAALQIPVAAIPKDSGQLTFGEFESVSWYFPEYKGLPQTSVGTNPSIEVTLLVLLAFDDRYSDDPNFEKAALEWVEERVLGLLVNWRPDGARTPIEIVSGRLFAPESGRWQKEIRLSFEALVTPTEVVGQPPTPLVRQITVEREELRQIVIESGELSA